LSRESEKVIKKKIRAFKIPIFITKDRGLTLYTWIKSIKYKTSEAAVRKIKISFIILSGKKFVGENSSLNINSNETKLMKAWNFIFFLIFAVLISIQV